MKESESSLDNLWIEEENKIKPEAVKESPSAERRSEPIDSSIKDEIQNIDLDIVDNIITSEEENDSDIEKLKLNYINATVQYYREIIRKEDILVLKKVMDEKKSLSPKEDILFKNLSFQNIKLYHIWNIEKHMMLCFENEIIPKDDRISVLESSREILSDFDAHSEDYKKMFIGLASRGISAYHLFQGMCVFNLKEKFNFDHDSLLKLGKIIVKKFEENLRIEKRLETYYLCRNLLKKFFIHKDSKLQVKNSEVIQKSIQGYDKEVKAHINELRYYFDDLVEFKENIESNYEFLLYFHELKDSWHNKCVERLKKANQNQNLHLFLNIQQSFFELKEHIKRSDLASFGPALCKYYDLCETMYMLAKYLHTAYFMGYNTSKAGEMQLHIRKLENYFGIMEWTSV